MGMRKFVSDCADSDTVLEGDALADGLSARLQPVEDLQGASVIGGYCSGWHPVKSRAEMLEGFWHAPLLQ